MKVNEIALTLYTVRNFCQTEKDLLSTLKKIKKIGYNAIQVSSIGPIDPKEVKKMCDDIGLSICATHEPNEEIINNTQAVIDKLNILNCSYTALPYPKDMDFLNLNVLDKFIADINKAGLVFSKADKVLCYHNHALEFQKTNNEIILERIYNKTATLFCTASLGGAILGGGNDEEIINLRNYGYNLGMAYQIYDDVLDYTANSETLGKPSGNDLLSGVITLPTIIAYENGSKDLIDKFISSKESIREEMISELINEINKTGAVEKTKRIADKHIHETQKILLSLPNNRNLESLKLLSDYVGTRSY